MIERLIVLVLAVAAIGVATCVVRAWARHRTSSLTGTRVLGPLGVLADGRPTIVSFSTPSCAACHMAQAPAVESVAGKWGVDRLRVVRVDAASQPQIASAFGVLTVPSTAVVAADGRLVQINHGFAPAATLEQQLQHA